MIAKRPPRNEARCPVRLPVVYWGEEFLGEGTVVTVSPHGLLLVGNYSPIMGTGMRMRLSVPDDPAPLYVTHAVVRRVRGLELGVELLIMTDGDRNRLEAFLARLVRPRQVSGATAWPWEDNAQWS